jgi:uncharacterized membrane protein
MDAGREPEGWTEEQVETFVGVLLRVGVTLAAGVVLLSGAFYLIRHGGEMPHYRVFRGEPDDLRHVGRIFAAARGGLARAAIQLGILLLVATPIARVAFSIVAFARQRDLKYVVVTCGVLALLLYGLLGSA